MNRNALPHRRTRRRTTESGSVLVWALFASLIVGGIVVSGLTTDEALERSGGIALNAEAQARAVAEAGIVDAYAWFRRQSVQPVQTFAPRRDLAAVPPVNETDDPSVGLVREYEVTPSLWARYEVRLTRAAEPIDDANGNGRLDPGETFTDANGNGVWDPAGETRDVSAERGHAGRGAVWMLVSHGMVFARPRRDLPLGTDPNRRLALARAATEIRRLALTPPAGAAICAVRGGDVVVGNRGRVAGGGGAGLAYASGTGQPSLAAGSEVTGSPSHTAVPDYDGSIEGVFGVSLSELRSLADVSTSDPGAVPPVLGDYTLTVLDGSITFDAARPLRGTGILVVLGDCTIADASNSFFSGVLWVGGRLEVRAPSYLRGILVAQGRVDVRGTGGDYAEVDYDAGILGELLGFLGQYRHSKAVFRHEGERLADRLRGTP